MASTARAAPAHLWIVGILALLWNGYGSYDYLMTMTRNQAYLSQFTADQIAYWESLPEWLTAFWALGVWGGLAGAVLLLVRSRYSVWAFGISLVGALVGMIYPMVAMQVPDSLKEGMMAVIPWVIIIIAAFLFWYAWNMDKKGVLR